MKYTGNMGFYHFPDECQKLQKPQKGQGRTEKKRKREKEAKSSCIARRVVNPVTLSSWASCWSTRDPFCSSLASLLGPCSRLAAKIKTRFCVTSTGIRNIGKCNQLIYKDYNPARHKFPARIKIKPRRKLCVCFNSHADRILGLEYPPSGGRATSTG